MAHRNAEERKAYRKRYHKEWYARNKDKQRDRASANRKRYRAEWNKFKSEQVCSHCGASHPAVIDFHHKNPAPDDKKVNKLTSNSQYKAARKEVEERCIPLCANCHRVLHWNETHD